MTSKLLLTLLISTILAVGLVGYASAGSWYVDKAGDNTNGKTWTTAWHTIQQGIGSCSGTSADTVNVAVGTYVENITLKSYVTLLGGYVGETILDGGAAGCAVVLNSVSGVTVDGFTIQNGSAAGSINGAGIWCKYAANATLSDCLVRDNIGYSVGGLGWGGAISCWSSSVVVDSCTVTANSCGGIVYYQSSGTIAGSYITHNTGGEFGGIYCTNNSSPTITNCVISDNANPGYDGQVGGFGGGISSYGPGCSPTVTHCTLTNNTGRMGGAIYCNQGSPTIKNCLITGNTAVNWGGGIEVAWKGKPSIQNCTFYGNTAGSGGAIYCGGQGASATAINSILWANSPNQIGGTASMTYSCIQGGWTGKGNVKTDPRFITGPLGSYYLSQLAGEGTKSPCVDTGSGTAASWGLDTYTTRTDNVGDAGKVDMGYHYPPAN